VPDPPPPGFAAGVQRQCNRVNAADSAEDLMTWIEDVSIFDDEDAGGDKPVHDPR